MPQFSQQYVHMWGRRRSEGLIGTGAVLTSSLSASACHHLISADSTSRKNRRLTKPIISSVITEALFGRPSSLTIPVTIWGDKEVQRSTLLTLQFPSQLRPPAPKISQAGDLGVVADSIHVNLKHTRACVQCVFSIAGPHALGLWCASWQLLKHSHPERRITITISDQFLGEIGHS